MAADSWQALQQLHAQHAGSLNIIHVSAMLTRLTRCQHQQQQQGSRLALRAFLQQLEQLSLQLMASVEQVGVVAFVRRSSTLAVSLLRDTGLLPLPACFARLQLPQAAAAAVEVVHPGSGSSSRDGSSQLLFLQPPVPQTQLQQRKQSSHGGSSSSSTWQRPGTAVMPQQLANMAWVSCAGREGGRRTSGAATIRIATRQPAFRPPLKRPELRALPPAPPPQCHATLGYQPSAVWWDAYWGASAPLLQTFNSRELANTIWAASKLQQVRSAVWMACVRSAGAAKHTLPVSTRTPLRRLSPVTCLPAALTQT
jgi:hypothetical protein